MSATLALGEKDSMIPEGTHLITWKSNECIVNICCSGVVRGYNNAIKIKGESLIVRAIWLRSLSRLYTVFVTYGNTIKNPG